MLPFKIESNERQQKMDVPGIFKDCFVKSRLYEDSDGSLLLPHSLLLAQCLAKTGYSNNHRFVCLKQKSLKSFLKVYCFSYHD